jgi:hypothetical protein
MEFDNYVKLGRPGKVKLYKKLKKSTKSLEFLEKNKFRDSYGYLVIETTKLIFIYKIMRNVITKKSQNHHS